MRLNNLLLCAIWMLLPLGGFAQMTPDRIDALKEDAKNGKPLAMHQLGLLYEEGRYEKQNLKRAISLYEEAAGLQYDSARYELGRLHELGKGLPQNFDLALQYYTLATTKTIHAEALFRMAGIYEKGLGTGQADMRSATAYYLKAWKHGYLPAQTKLETLNVDSLADNKDVAYVYYQAYKGDPKSLYQSGLMMEEGIGLGKNPAKAFDYYQQAAQKGFIKAYIALGDMYAKGIHVQKNMRLAVKNYLVAAESGDTEALDRLKKLDLAKEIDTNSLEYISYQALSGEAAEQYRLYLRYFNGDGVPRNYDLAIEYCQRAASENYEKAIMALANMHYRGFLVQRDLPSAFEWYRRASLLNNDSALFMLGEMYATGQGTQQNMPKAVRCYLMASNSGIQAATERLSQYDLLKFVDQYDLEYMKYKASRGDLQAQLAVGKYYFKQNNGDAVGWLRMAALQQNDEAQLMLGEIHYKGLCNMPIDNEEALQWFTLAAAQKNLASFRYLADMYAKNLIPSTNDNTELAFKMANEYLTLKKGNLGQEDAYLYKTMGDIYMQRDDWPNAIIYYTEYIRMYGTDLGKPMDLINAFEMRAKAYFQLQRYASVVNDLDFALFKLDEHKEHASIKFEYPYIKGYFLVEKTRAHLAEQNYFKACNTLQEAIKMGAKVPQDFIDTCMKN